MLSKRGRGIELREPLHISPDLALVKGLSKSRDKPVELSGAFPRRGRPHGEFRRPSNASAGPFGEHFSSKHGRGVKLRKPSQVFEGSSGSVSPFSEGRGFLQLYQGYKGPRYKFCTSVFTLVPARDPVKGIEIQSSIFKKNGVCQLPVKMLKLN